MAKMRRTKIVTTLGPATDRPGVLEGIIKAGANVVRINFSHGSAEDHAKRVAEVRRVSKEVERPVAIMGDLQGPKIRIGSFKDGPINLQVGDQFILDAELDLHAGNQERVGLTYKELPHDLKPGDILLLDDGRIQLAVTKVEGSQIYTTVIVAGVLSNSKGINKQGGGLSAPALTEKDKRDIKTAAALDLDYIAVSFPRCGDDLREARRLLDEAGCHARIVAKVERAEAVESEDAMRDIIMACDAVMVARGDLGVEIGDARLMSVQKKLINFARGLDRVVITATQMMESMIKAPMPTRAEVMDVSNAVLDGTDAVMLSAETAAGDFPVETVRAMSNVCHGAELSIQRSGYRAERTFETAEETIAITAMFAANHLRGIHGLVAFTDTGRLPLLMSRIRSGLPIYAFSRHPQAVRWMNMYRGVFPFEFDTGDYQNRDEILRRAVDFLVEKGLVQTGDKVVIAFGVSMGKSGHTDSMRVVTV
ncbi:MAG: pyruvate kinase [Proteobacteria bacterium]|uniref:Pyruvate kinase n=1 Tax=Candidatus Avisuccinivibrio stercorigallinarum TaxID=2840704 RepID=A0A9D9DAK4_9GAMM|nr:pyruvate kinase [Candidatus Avisuccinivibrio stercorigallinarum]